MNDTACIAIDLGATSGRVILAKMKHGRLETEILNRFPNVIKEIDGRCYWDIYSLFDSIKEGLNMAASRRIAIDSIGVDTWGVDFCCVRPDGSFVSLPRGCSRTIFPTYSPGRGLSFDRYTVYEFQFAVPTLCDASRRQYRYRRSTQHFVYARCHLLSAHRKRGV